MLLSAFFLHFLSCCFHRPSAVILQENQMDQLLWKDRDVSQNVKHKEYHFVSINMPHGVFSDWYILSTVFDYFQLLYKLEDYVEIERTEGGYSVSSFCTVGNLLGHNPTNSQSVGNCYNTVQYLFTPSQQAVHQYAC